MFLENSETKIIYKLISDTNKWKQWVDTSSKNELPPYFYNDKLKLMLDVMQIYDDVYVYEKV